MLFFFHFLLTFVEDESIVIGFSLICAWGVWTRIMLFQLFLFSISPFFSSHVYEKKTHTKNQKKKKKKKKKKKSFLFGILDMVYIVYDFCPN